MRKLTDAETKKAKEELRDKVVRAIEESPRGLPELDVREVVTNALFEVFECTSTKAY